LDPRRSVLIVDQSDESREVLRTVLEHRGLRILEASAADQGLEMARRHQPDLIVLDLEVDAANARAVTGEFASYSGPGSTPLVLLGSARRSGDALPGTFVAKPYHYAPLIRKIEQLLSG
jgi:CheY-like chemotaxis protein